MINDMIIGITGATYSTIFFKEINVIKLKVTNVPGERNSENFRMYFENLENGEGFVSNSEYDLFSRKYGGIPIHSAVGVPIFIRSEFLGFIVIEHSLFHFFSSEHIKFASLIANQIGIGLSNNILYKKVRENLSRDPLLNIVNRKHFF